MAENIRVLVVDDDSEVGELTAEFLGRTGDRIVAESVTDPEEALSRLRSRTPDCVVSDYEMPVMDGIEFLEAVRSERPELPFVLFTGKGSEEVASDAISVGATDYLRKRSGAEQYELLANRIRNAVGQYRSAVRLRQTREEYATVFENVQSGLLLVGIDDGDFVYQRCNARHSELTGLSDENIVGRTPRAVLGRENGRKVAAAYRACIDRRESVEFTVDLDLPAGHVVHECEVTPVPADEEIEQLVVSIQDITGRRRREAELRRTAARLETLFENSPDMINVHDAEGNLLDPNPRLCEKTGYTETELTGMKVWELDVGMDPDVVTGIWAEMAVGDRHRLSGEYRRTDGTTFPVEVHLRRFVIDDESRFLVISRDITAQREREAELRQYKQIVTTMQESACIYDTAGRFEVVNEYLAGFYDTSPAALVGQQSRLIPQIRAQADGDPYQELLDGERSELRGEVTRKFPGRGEASVAYRLTPLVVDDEVVGAVGVANDVTHHRERERELEQKNQQLEEFAGVVSHDLRNPLDVVRGRLELLEEGAPGEHAEVIDRNLARMESIIDDVLRLARTGDTLDGIESVALDAVASGCWQSVDTGAADLDIDASETIRGDGDRLRRLFENLYRNAVEHGSTGDRTDDADGTPEVTVTVGTLADGFYVEDDGPGIPEDKREQIFEAGYSTADEGTGFGLRIVEQIATAHGWDVEVTDGSDGGARFVFTGVEFDETDG